MQDLSPQADYWDRVADEKRFSHPLCTEWLSHHLESSQSLILDYGCGYGRTLEDLRSNGYRKTVGVDFSEGMLARCRSSFPGQSLIRNDGRTLPFTDGSFDLVLLFAVLTCIPPEAEQRALVDAVGRVLRSGGLLYISDLLLNEDARNRKRYERFAEAYGIYGIFELPEGVLLRHHAGEWIADLTRSFEQLEYQPFSVTTMNGNPSSAFQYLGRKARLKQES